MTTKKCLRGLGIVALNGLLVLTAPAQTIRVERRSIQVRYSNGTASTFRIEWKAGLRVERWESGGPARPFALKFSDDRECQWQIWGEIRRDVFRLQPDGKVPAGEELGETLHLESDGGIRSPRQWKTPLGQNCADADAQKRFEQDADEVRDLLDRAFQGKTEADLQQVKQRLRERPNVVHAIELPREEEKPDEKVRKEIQMVLESYKLSLEKKDVALFQKVYPVGEADLQRVEDAFKRTRSHTVTLNIESIEVIGSVAEARGFRKDDFTSKEGRVFHNESAFVFKLKRTPKGWVIVTLN